MWLFPLLAALVSGLFAALVLRSWAIRRGPHLLAWGTALVMFTLAALATAIGILFGWTPALFRTYYLFGAILNVPVLALGTLYLLAPRRVAHVCTIVVVVLAVGATIDMIQAPLNEAALNTDGIPEGSKVLAEEIRTLSRVFSFSGFFVVVGGAVWSAVRLTRQGGTHFRRLAQANVMIAAGTTVVASASAFVRYGRGSLFAVGLLVGVSLMFLGFVRTRPEGDGTVMLAEGWYLMSVSDLEKELARVRDPKIPPTDALHLSTQEALAYRNRGNIPDESGRSLRLVLHVRDAADLMNLSKRRLEFEPDFHDEPTWRTTGSLPVNVVPLRLAELGPQEDREWWNEPEVAELEAEWVASGSVAGINVPEAYRSFVYKTVLSLRAANRPVSVRTIHASVSRWLSPEDAEELRKVLEEANR